MYQQAVASEQWGNEELWAGIPSVNDLMECPNCGWKGHSSELVVSGFETDFVDEVVSGECSLECPDCRVDAGHMLYGWGKSEEIIYCEEDLQIARMATNILAHTLENTYQIVECPEKPIEAISNKYKSEPFRHRSILRNSLRIQKAGWKRKAHHSRELKMVVGF